MSVAQLNGTEIHYDDLGKGVAIMLVHGHPFDRTMWRPQAEVLVDLGYRVVTADLRGYGESEVVPGVTALATFADDAVKLLDKLGIEAAAFVGLSMGGQVVMDVAERYPERVAALVLADTFPDSETAEGHVVRMETADQLVRDGMEEYATAMLPKMISSTTLAQLPDVAEHVRTMMLGASPAGAAAALRGRALRREYISTLLAVRVPTLIIVGDEDEFTPVADAERMHNLVPNSQLVVVQGAGHLPNLERPDEFNDALIWFLRRHA